MAALAIAVAGSYLGGTVGAAVGSAAIGSYIGYAIGSYIGAVMFAPEVKSPRIDDLRWSPMEYGAPIPWFVGTVPLPGIPIWMSEKRVVEGSSGGKGSPDEPTPTRYYADVMYMLADCESDALIKLFMNGELEYDGSATMDVEALLWHIIHGMFTGDYPASPKYSALRFYGGDALQEPDPDYALAKTNAPAYRGRTTVFFKDLELPAAQLPQMRFIVARDASGSFTSFVEEFENELADYDETSGGGQFSIIDTPYGNGILGADPSTGTYVVIRTIPAISARAFAFKFRIDSATAEDCTTLTLMNGGAVVFEFNPRRDVSVDAAQRPFIEWDGFTDLFGTQLPPHVWYFASGWIDAAGDFQFRITNESGMTLAEHTLAGSYTTFTVNKIVWGVNPDSPGDPASQATYVDLTIADGGVTPEVPTLPEVITELCERAGLDAAQIDVSGLPDTEVRGVVATQVTNVRSLLQQVMSWHYVDCVDGPTLKFVQRGGASLATIPFNDLIREGDSEPLSITVDNDLERPGYVSLTYLNVDQDFEKGIEYSDRLTTDSNGVGALEFAVVGVPSEAKGRANTIVYDAQVSRTKLAFALPETYAEVEPTDVLTVTDENDIEYRCRVIRLTDDNGARKIDAVLDDASILVESGITSEDYEVVTMPRAPFSELILIDTGLLHDTTDEAGLYAAVDGSGRWRAASLQRSIDNASYVEVAEAHHDAISGYAVTALGAWSGGWVWDEVNTVQVRVTGELSNSTRDAMQADPTVNAAALKGSDGYWEVFRFRTRVLITAHDDDSNTYELSGLLRGLQGTEQHTGSHAASGKFVLLTPTTVVSIADQTANIGEDRYYKAVSFGTAVSQAPWTLYAQQSVRLLPWAPTDVRGDRDGSGNLTITWNRRTRLSTRYGGSGGSLVPLGEESEAYSILIRNGADTATLRTISATSETASYSAADQTTDFGSTQAAIHVRVAQVSASVGAGYYTSRTV